MIQHDILIKDVMIIDGTGSQRYKADVGINKGKIDYIGRSNSVYAKQIINGQGLVLSPGFIDMHSHSDLFLQNDRSVFNKLEQGITTETVGHCGASMAPVSKRYIKELRKYIGYPDDNSVEEPENWDEFNTFDRYLKSIEASKHGTNLAFFLGQGTIRIAVMGFENRHATIEEIDKMKDIVREGMENGALGISTGLIYAPGVFTPKEEIIELCKVVKEYDGTYATHMRSESGDIINALKEAIDIGRQSGVKVIISHHKISGKNNWGKSVETLRLIEQANKEGINVSLDQYPYSAGSTHLSTIIPPKYQEGGLKALVSRLKDKSNFEMIKRDMLDTDAGWDNLLLNSGFEGIVVYIDGRQVSIEQYAKEKSIDPIEAVFEILIRTNGECTAVFFLMCDDDINRIMKHQLTMVGTDAGIFVPQMGKHPRSVGTFPRILGRYVREQKLLSLEEAIRKMTYLTAQKAGLKGKGIIKQGYDADLVIFDPDKIVDRYNYSSTEYEKNEGIEYVIINGEIAVKNNSFTGVYAGKVIKRG